MFPEGGPAAVDAMGATSPIVGIAGAIVAF